MPHRVEQSRNSEREAGGPQLLAGFLAPFSSAWISTSSSRRAEELEQLDVR
jgi:hypothetical protein